MVVALNPLPEAEPMAQIVISDDQLAVIQAATDAVAIRDKSGNLVGYVSPMLAGERMAKIRERLKSDGPWYTTKEVLDHLQSWS
jgi:hypothetical protein